MALLPDEFPRGISFHRTGGISFNTTVITTGGGQEFRNANWAVGRAKYTASIITPASAVTPADFQNFIDTLRNLFIAAKGKLNAFHFYDHVIQQDVIVRFDTDEFNLQVEPSDVLGGAPIVSWNNLVLVEVLPPNY